MAHADTGSQTIGRVARLEHWILKEKLGPKLNGQTTGGAF